MQTIKMKPNDVLVIDPCYIKGVDDSISTRFDALKLVRTLHEGDDGDYYVANNGYMLAELGVDSGRIWAMQVEFWCNVKIDAGPCGYLFQQFDTDAEAKAFIDALYVNSANVIEDEEDE